MERPLTFDQSFTQPSRLETFGEKGYMISTYVTCASIILGGLSATFAAIDQLCKRQMIPLIVSKVSSGRFNLILDPSFYLNTSIRAFKVAGIAIVVGALFFALMRFAKDQKNQLQ